MYVMFRNKVIECPVRRGVDPVLKVRGTGDQFIYFSFFSWKLLANIVEVSLAFASY